MVLNRQDFYRFSDFELHPSKRALLRGDQKVMLAPKSFEVLTCLVQNAGRVVLKEELLKSVWPESFVEESNLTQHIFWLRKALGDCATFIVTVPGRGYQFTPKVIVLNETEQGEPRSVSTVNPLSFAEEIIDPQIFPVAAGRLSSRLRLFIPAAAVVVAALLIGGYWRMHHRAVPGDHHEIVLASFENTTGDPTFDHALSTLLAIDLDQSQYLVAVGNSETRKALELMNRKPDELLTTPLALEVCQRLNAQAVLSGTIATVGHRYLVTLTAADCQTGHSLIQSKATAVNRDEVITAVDSIAGDMRQKLGESLMLHRNTGMPLQPVHTFSLDALKVYSQALAQLNAERPNEAIPLFLHAIELDPTFAAAYLDLARCYARLREDSLAAAAASKAYALRDGVDDSLRLRIVSVYETYVTGDQEAKLRNALVWTSLYPNQVQPWIDTATLQDQMGHPEAGVEYARHAVVLAPDSANALAVLCYTLYRSGEVQQGKAVCQQALDRGLDSSRIHLHLYNIALIEQDNTAIAQQLAWVTKTRNDFETEQLYALLGQGKVHVAVTRWLQMVDQAKKDGLEERANRLQTILLRREADYDLLASLKQQIQLARPSLSDPVNIIIGYIALGRLDLAQKIRDARNSTLKPRTANQDYYIAQADAALAIAHHKPEDAIHVLAPLLSWGVQSPEPNLLRGQAYLAARQPNLAAAEFRKITDYPYISPAGPAHPLAQLGLARAREMQGDHAASRADYEKLFAMWSSADPDLPPLLKARAEYAAIQ